MGYPPNVTNSLLTPGNSLNQQQHQQQLQSQQSVAAAAAAAAFGNSGLQTSAPGTIGSGKFPPSGLAVVVLCRL